LKQYEKLYGIWQLVVALAESKFVSHQPFVYVPYIKLQEKRSVVTHGGPFFMSFGKQQNN
jgi:hypothetical protein